MSKNEELQTDDEALREIGFTSRPSITTGIKMRPMTALSLSWMQRNQLFEEGIGDLLQKTAAFAFLHSEPKDRIQSVVNDRAEFRNAVDDWIEKNIGFHTELEPLSEMMNAAMEAYMASSTKAAHPSDSKGPEAKN
jgi:hypothetical protein